MAIAFIPARGGSKSIPLKNIKEFCGKPLIFWSIKALERNSHVASIIVATDDAAIAEVVNGFGFSKVRIFNRSDENAQDHSSTESVMLEYLQGASLQPRDFFLLVQATNPFITSEHIDEAFQRLKDERADSLLTCVRTKRFFWDRNGVPLNYDYKNRPRRQDFEGMLMENGAFYISNVEQIVQTGNRLSGKIAIYEMPEYSAFEIDEPEDWLIMENLFSRLPANIINNHRTSQIKLLISDVDGVLTDAGMYYSETGDELKKFNTHDGMGFQLLRQAGIRTGIVTTENTKIVERRAAKLKLDYLYQGKGFGGKLDVIKSICEQESISLDEVAYIGDDVNCFEALQAVGIKACPANAVKIIKEIPGIWHLQKNGGEGAVREFIDRLFEERRLHITKDPKSK